MTEPVSSLAFAGMPISRTRLIGPESERAAARALLLNETVPLLTLTGPGGVGKTRLAQAIAADLAECFADGIVWVDLALISDATLAPAAAAEALDLTPDSGETVADLLARYLRRRQTLLLFDNCKHVLPVVADLAGRLLNDCPALQVVATSRAPLHLRGERILFVEPLPLPPESVDSLEELQQNDAVRLFMERARAVRPVFRLDDGNAAAVKDICLRLDGLPLAIELAAARITILSPEALLARMTERLRLLKDGPRDLPFRQQTMRRAIAWSYELLDESTQHFFRHLSIFTDGWTLEAATAVAGLDDCPQRDVVSGIASLIAQSLVRRVDTSGEMRFSMLETIREFGLDLLINGGEHDAARDAHVNYFRDFITAQNLLHFLPGDRSWLSTVVPDQANFRSALDWCARVGDEQSLNALAAGLYRLWLLRSQFEEGRHWLEQAITVESGVPVVTRSQVHSVPGRLAFYQRDFAAAELLLGEGLALARESEVPVRIAEALLDCSVLASAQGVEQRVIALTKDALEVAQGLSDTTSDKVLLAATALLHLGHTSLQMGKPATAKRYLADAISLQRSIGDSWGLSLSQINLGVAQLWDGASADAAAHLLEGLALSYRHHDRHHLFRALYGLAAVATCAGQTARAADLLGAVTRERDSAGTISWQLAPTVERSLKRLGHDLRALNQMQPGHAGSALPIDQAVAVGREVARVVLGDVRVDAMWRNSDAPDPGLVPIAPERATTRKMPLGDSGTPVAFTSREQEVLTLLCQRQTNAEIAAHLFISARTVETHVMRVLGKLDAPNRREAAAVAARLGLI